LQEQTYRPIFKSLSPTRDDPNPSDWYVVRLREFERNGQPIEGKGQPILEPGVGASAIGVALKDLVPELESWVRTHPEQPVTLPHPTADEAPDGWKLLDADSFITVQIEGEYVNAWIGKV